MCQIKYRSQETLVDFFLNILAKKVLENSVFRVYDYYTGLGLRVQETMNFKSFCDLIFSVRSTSSRDDYISNVNRGWMHINHIKCKGQGTQLRSIFMTYLRCFTLGSSNVGLLFSFAPQCYRYYFKCSQFVLTSIMRKQSF